jgi:hypothetical protein
MGIFFLRTQSAEPIRVVTIIKSSSVALVKVKILAIYDFLLVHQ